MEGLAVPRFKKVAQAAFGGSVQTEATGISVHADVLELISAAISPRNAELQRAAQ